jgi:hypothetical protein
MFYLETLNIFGRLNMKPELQEEIAKKICRKCWMCAQMLADGMDPTFEYNPELENKYHGAHCPGGKFHPDLNRPRKDYVPSETDSF